MHCHVIFSTSVDIDTDKTIFLGQFCPGGKDAVRLTLGEAPTRETRPDQNTRTYVPYTCSVASLSSPADHGTLKMQDTGHTI